MRTGRCDMITAEGISFGEWLRMHREKSGLSQQRLADLVGTTNTQISGIELGTRAPLKPSIMLEIGDLLKIDELELESKCEAVICARALERWRE